MKQKVIDVSICIISFDTKDYLDRCLFSLYKLTKGITFEIIVIDNASPDRSAEMVKKKFPRVRLVRNNTNRWFSGANNQATKKAKGEYIFFLNPDTWISENVINDLKEWMDHHPDVGACEPRQIGSDGHIAPTGSLLNRWWIDLIELTALSRLFGSVGRIGIFKKPRAIRLFRQKEKNREKDWQTEVASGAAFFSRAEAIRKAEGFNERLKLYYTDTDLCRKLILDGWSIWHVGRFSLFHSLSVSTSKLSWKERSNIYTNDARTYYGLMGKTAQSWILYIAMTLHSRVVALLQ